jgi:hypothetical protein
MAKIASRGEALRLHQLGWSVPRIARELGVKDDSVRRSLERAGVRLRGAATQPAGRDDADPANRLAALQAVVPVLDRFNRLAGAIRELATEYLFGHSGEPAAQELMVAARRIRDDAGDCLFYGGVVFGRGALDTGAEAASAGPDLETIRFAIRLLQAAGTPRAEPRRCPGSEWPPTRS